MQLFTVFHANLAFSSIPSEHYDWILDNCYWPLLDFVETEKIKTGLEFSGHTLSILQKLDPLFVEKIKELKDHGLLEPVCGAQYQSIGPLMPVEDNAYNYITGRKTFAELLDYDAKLLYIPEQTVSKGILDVIAKSGYDIVFVEWNNSVRFGTSAVEKKLLYQSPLFESLNGIKLRILWNHSVLFQKVQRYIFGEIEIRDVLSFLKQEENGNIGMLCFYGSDLEVFGYFPGNTLQFDPNLSIQRWDRYKALVDTISQTYDFILPSQGVKDHHTDERIALGSTAFPILCKKQPKYNPVRWSVCGRGAYQLNQACFSLSEKIKLLARSKNITPEDEENIRKQLAPCWTSDYRTFTTEEKWFQAYKDLNKATHVVEQAVSKAKKSHALKANEVLVLTDRIKSFPFIFEKDLRFKPGSVLPGAEAYLELEHPKGKISRKIKTQWENIHKYADGYVRSATVVFQINEPVPSSFRIKFSGRDISLISEIISNDVIDAEKATQVKFNFKRGLSIESLLFKEISNVPLIGTIPHGYFESIDWDADFYSGTAQLDTGMDFYHDLTPVHSVLCSTGTIRTLIEGVIPMGPLKQKKKYAIYHHIPRLDLIQSFMVKQLNSVSFRTGIVTLLPEAWCRDKLYMITQNGGNNEEVYYLSGHRVDHSEPVKSGISSRSCLGATGGWTAITDREKTVTISRSLMKGFSVPLFRYEEIGEQFFARLYHSLGERDETSLFNYRGLLEEYFTITASTGETFNRAQTDVMVFQNE